MKRNLTLALMFLTFTNAYKILCLLPYPGKSHFLVFEPLLDQLAERGHNLTVVSFFPSKTPHPNRRDVSLVGLAPIGVEILDLTTLESSFNFGNVIGNFLVVQDVASKCVDLCEKLLYEQVFEEFVNAKGEYDLIITEHFFSDCMLGLAYNYGLPHVGLMTHVPFPWTLGRVAGSENRAYVPSVFLPLTEDMSFLERVQNTIVSTLLDMWEEIAIRRKEQEILEKRYGRKLPKLQDIAKNTSAILVNTYFVFNGVRSLPPSVVEVGGIHIDNKTVQRLPMELDTWLSGSKDGVIVFSFGSLIRGSSLPKRILKAFIKVFAKIPQRVLWKWESDEIEDLPPNVRVIGWLPQYEVLQHPNCVAFITHGGLLGLTEAVSAGVPLLVVPVFGDQFHNAAHASRAGIAQIMHWREINEDTLYSALQTVLSPELRSRSSLVRDMWRSRPLSPMSLALHHVELAAQFGSKLTLSSHARYLTTAQLMLVDVALCVTGFITLILCLFLLVVKGVCCRKSKKAKDKLS